MIPLLKAEFRKLFSIRSTYVMIALALVAVSIFAFYSDGLKSVNPVQDPNKLISEVTNAVSLLSALGALVAILLMTHEYRYNTILYTLTASRSRSRVLLAKFIVVSIFAILFTFVFAILSPALATLGMHIKGVHMVNQNFPIVDLYSRALFTGWGYAIFGLLFAVLIRVQVGAIVAFFLVPNTVELLIGGLLKSVQQYLPFAALQAVLGQGIPGRTALSHSHAALVFLLYMLIGWLIAWQLFLRRDAN